MTEVDPRRIEWLPLDDLMDNPSNPKAHADSQIDASMGKHGVIDLITRDDRTGFIVSGHGRTKALRSQHARGDEPPEGVRVEPDGTWLVPVVTGWASTDDLDAAAVLIKLNRLTELGGWVDESLLALLDDLRGADRFDGIGFTDEDHAALEHLVNPPAGRTDPDDVPRHPTTPPISQPWDLWTLGTHRLAVGPSDDAATWERLATTGAACMWTDPPLWGVLRRKDRRRYDHPERLPHRRRTSCPPSGRVHERMGGAHPWEPVVRLGPAGAETRGLLRRAPHPWMEADPDLGQGRVRVGTYGLPLQA